MKISKFSDAEGRTPPRHFDMRTFSLIEKVHGSDENLALSLSYYLPGGGADFGPQPVEVIFYVLEGQITIETEDGSILVPQGEAIHISRGEKKAVKNKANCPASILVIANVPADFAPPPPPHGE